MTLTTTTLANSYVLVEGTDVRGVYAQQVLDGREWVDLKRESEIARAHDDFDSKVEEFFSDLTEAAAELEQAHQVELDPLLYIVEQEGTPGTEATREVVRELRQHTAVLRAIETGQVDRVIWVNGELVITAEPQEPVVETSNEDEDEDEDEDEVVTGNTVTD